MLQTQKAEYTLLESQKEMDGKSYQCFGVRLSYAGTEVCVEDLSLNRSEVEKLVKLCNEKLSAAEQKVRILTEGADGAVSDKPFDDNEA